MICMTMQWKQEFHSCARKLGSFGSNCTQSTSIDRQAGALARNGGRLDPNDERSASTTVFLAGNRTSEAHDAHDAAVTCVDPEPPQWSGQRRRAARRSQGQDVGQGGTAGLRIGPGGRCGRGHHWAPLRHRQVRPTNVPVNALTDLYDSHSSTAIPIPTYPHVAHACFRTRRQVFGANARLLEEGGFQQPPRQILRQLFRGIGPPLITTGIVQTINL